MLSLYKGEGVYNFFFSLFFNTVNAEMLSLYKGEGVYNSLYFGNTRFF